MILAMATNRSRTTKNKGTISTAVTDLDELEEMLVERCLTLSEQPELIRNHTLPLVARRGVASGRLTGFGISDPLGLLYKLDLFEAQGSYEGSDALFGVLPGVF